MNFPKPAELPLRCAPGATWTRAWNKLDAAAASLINPRDRELRLRNHLDYLRANASELASARDRVVFELTPGPCDLLDVARYLGHVGAAIQPPPWDIRTTACQLLHARQGFDVRYGDIAVYMEYSQAQVDLLAQFADRCTLINITCLLELLPLEQNANNGQAHVDRDAVTAFFSLMYSLLCPSGLLLVGYGQGKHSGSDEVVRDVAREQGLSLVRNGHVQKWRRI